MKLKKALKKFLGEARSKTAESGTGFELWCQDNLNIQLLGKESGVDRHASIPIITDKRFVSINEMLTKDLTSSDIKISFEDFKIGLKDVNISLFKADGYWTSEGVFNNSSGDILLNTETTTSDWFDVIKPGSSFDYKNKENHKIEMKKTTGYPVFTRGNNKGGLKFFMFSELKKIKSQSDLMSRLSDSQKKNIREYVERYNRNLRVVRDVLNKSLEEYLHEIQRLIYEKLKGQKWFVILGDQNFDKPKGIKRYNKEQDSDASVVPFIAIREMRILHSHFLGKIKRKRFMINRNTSDEVPVDRLVVNYHDSSAISEAAEEDEDSDYYKVFEAGVELLLDIQRQIKAQKQSAVARYNVLMTLMSEEERTRRRKKPRRRPGRRLPPGRTERRTGRGRRDTDKDDISDSTSYYDKIEKNIKLIIEEFETARRQKIDDEERYYEIFKNPTSKELKEVSFDKQEDIIRGFMRADGNLYVVSPQENLIHSSILKILSNENILSEDKNWYFISDGIYEKYVGVSSQNKKDWYLAESYGEADSLPEEYSKKYKALFSKQGKNFIPYTMFK